MAIQLIKIIKKIVWGPLCTKLVGGGGRGVKALVAQPLRNYLLLFAAD